MGKMADGHPAILGKPHRSHGGKVREKKHVSMFDYPRINSTNSTNSTKQWSAHVGAETRIPKIQPIPAWWQSWNINLDFGDATQGSPPNIRI